MSKRTVCVMSELVSPSEIKRGDYIWIEGRPAKVLKSHLESTLPDHQTLSYQTDEYTCCQSFKLDQMMLRLIEVNDEIEARGEILAENIENVSKLVSESMSINAGDVLERGPVSHAVPISEADLERLFSDFGRGVQEVSECVSKALGEIMDAAKKDPAGLVTELARARHQQDLADRLGAQIPPFARHETDKQAKSEAHDARELANIRNLLRGQGFTEASIQERPSSCVRMLVNDEERRVMVQMYASLLAAGMEPGDLSERLTDALEELNGLLEELEEFEAC